jgi:RNA polymerase sigma factor (sigma-70 family)
VLRSGPADVDDVVQSALERAWRHRDRCLQPDAPEGWVARIAHREALREYRRSRRQTVMADPPEIAAEPRDDAVLETLVVEAAMRELSDGERQLVHLRALQRGDRGPARRLARRRARPLAPAAAHPGDGDRCDLMS